MEKNRKSDSYGKTAKMWNKGRDIAFQKSDIVGVLQGCIITVIIAILFYKSYIALVSGLIIIPFWLGKYRKEAFEKRNMQINREFKDYMLLVSASLQAGYSVERSLYEAEKDMRDLYQNKSVLSEMIHKMNAKIKINVPTEKAFGEFAKEVCLDDAESLAEIIAFAKRGGGDYGKHIRNTAVKIEEKLSCQQEIDTMTSEKQLELKVMSCMPIGIMLYISVTSPEFIKPLYGNMTGIIIMTGCLFVYGAMLLLGNKFIRINI